MNRPDSKWFSIAAALLLSCLFCSCKRHDRSVGDSGLIDRKVEQYERALSHDPGNYEAMRNLAVIYGALYLREVQAGSSRASLCKEKALTLTRDVLKRAKLGDMPDLGINLERLGYEREALSVYEDFLEKAHQTPAPLPNFAPNAPPVLRREEEANWRSIIVNVQVRADMLKKMFAEQKVHREQVGSHLTNHHLTR